MTWDFEGYWNAVIGAHLGPDDVAREFGLDRGDRHGLDEWLGLAEAESWRVGAGEDGPIPSEWAEHHTRALDVLTGPPARRSRATRDEVRKLAREAFGPGAYTDARPALGGFWRVEVHDDARGPGRSVACSAEGASLQEAYGSLAGKIRVAAGKGAP